jgi:hypothetical protein
MVIISCKINKDMYRSRTHATEFNNNNNNNNNNNMNMDWALLETVPVAETIKNLPKFCTQEHYESQSWARSVQCIPPHPISLRSLLILTFHLHPVLPSGCPIEILYAFLSPLPPRAAFSAYLILLYLINLLALAKSTSYESPHYSVFSNLLTLLRLVQIISPASCSETTLVYVPPLISEY